jgi:uncharacterized protein YkwD
MQQHAHPARLQRSLHLAERTKRCRRNPKAVLTASLLACACAFAAGSATAASSATAEGSTTTAATARSTSATPSRACRGGHLRPNATNLAAVDAATLCLVNRVRAAHHVHALRSNRILGRVASSQIAAMVRGDYFADVSPSGQTPLALVARTPYPAHAASFAVGQNLAWGTENDVTPAHIVAEWMASPPHRAIMLSNEYRNAGVAVAPTVPARLYAGRPDATYAFEFGRRF